MREVKAPNKWERRGYGERVLFLAGSIEMDTAEKWQPIVVECFTDKKGLILNPRRDDWDASWQQSPDFLPFREQVEWELEGLQQSDRILLYLSDGTKSPISLLELGLHVHSGKFVVCCPQSFWRAGNVEIVCVRYKLPFFTSLEDGIRFLRKVL